MKCCLFLIALLTAVATGFAQGRNDSAFLDAYNRFIDHAVVKKDKAALDTVYADDFMFTHGGGHIDNKASWIAGVTRENSHFNYREHDSTIVELHGNIAMVSGRLNILRLDGEVKNKYAIRYVRVFLMNRGRWQMISHRTVQEWDHLPL